jgi:hypothetical protein
MLSISHSLTGAFIARYLPHPALYLPITLASHYLEDWIPHWDVGTGLSVGKRKRSTAIILELIELTITIGLVYWYWRTTDGHSWHIPIAAFVALIPDFMEAPRNFLKWEPGFLKPFNNFHHSFHHSTPHYVIGLLPQLVLWWLILGSASPVT